MSSQEQFTADLRAMFKSMGEVKSKSDFLTLLHKFIKTEVPARRAGIESVLKHLEEGKPLNDATVATNIKALLKATLSQDAIIANMAVSFMMLTMSDDWDKISGQARVKCGESQQTILQEMMAKKMGGHQ